jgi:hypothetical protein
MAELALHSPKNETAKTMPIATAFKNCTYRRKNWLPNRMREHVLSAKLFIWSKSAPWRCGLFTKPDFNGQPSQ